MASGGNAVERLLPPRQVRRPAGRRERKRSASHRRDTKGGGTSGERRPSRSPTGFLHDEDPAPTPPSGQASSASNANLALQNAQSAYDEPVARATLAHGDRLIAGSVVAVNIEARQGARGVRHATPRTSPDARSPTCRRMTVSINVNEIDTS